MLGFGAPLLCSAYIRLPVWAPSTRASTSVGVCRRNLTATWENSREGPLNLAEGPLSGLATGATPGCRAPSGAHAWHRCGTRSSLSSQRSPRVVSMRWGLFFKKKTSYSIPVLTGSCRRWSSALNISMQTLSRLHGCTPNHSGETKPSGLWFPGPKSRYRLWTDMSCGQTWAADGHGLQSNLEFALRMRCKVITRGKLVLQALRTDKRFNCATNW